MFQYSGCMEVLSGMKRIVRIIAVLLLVGTLTAVLPFSATAEQKMKVTASWLRLRSGPGMEYEIINKYRNGSVVTILTTKTNKHWYYVRTSKGQTGWMYKGYLTSLDTTMPAAKNATGMAVAHRNVNLRTGPGKKYDVIRLLPAGQNMVIIGKTGAWYKVVVGKKSGFVMKSHVKVK